MRVATLLLIGLVSRALAGCWLGGSCNCATCEVCKTCPDCPRTYEEEYKEQKSRADSLQKQLENEKAKTRSLTSQLTSKQGELDREEEYRDLNKEFVE